MDAIVFDTAVVPPGEGLATFRAASPDFLIDPLGDPAAFATGWRMVPLGDLNVVQSHGTPVRFRRTPEMIAPDGDHRIAIHFCLSGSQHGINDGRAVRVAPGGAMIWDLSRPLDLRSDEPIELIIVTLPRYLLQDAVPATSLAGSIAPGPLLTLAAEQARWLIDHADAIEPGAAELHARALCDLYAAAMTGPDAAVRWPTPEPPGPLQRVIDVIDDALIEPPGEAALARRAGLTPAELADALGPLGGLPVLIERRRLLAAYRQLRDEAEAATVSVVAHRCGFRSLPQFSRRFRQVFGVAASDIRRTGSGGILPEWAGAYPVTRLYDAMRVD